MLGPCRQQHCLQPSAGIWMCSSDRPLIGFHLRELLLLLVDGVLAQAVLGLPPFLHHGALGLQLRGDLSGAVRPKLRVISPCQDLTQSSSGVCVCSDARQSVNGATENAQRLARLSMELQTLEFLAPVASTGMPPTEVQLLASEALRQAANVSRPNIVATTVAVGGRVTPALTPTQVAYVAFSLALQQGFARSEAAMAALEVSSLDEDNNLAPLADVMILSGLDVPEAGDACRVRFDWMSS
eukprot:g6171.t1